MIRWVLRKVRAGLGRRGSLERWRAVYAAGAWGEQRRFLRSGQVLDFTSASPRLSVVVVLYGKAALTLRCLRSLRAQDFPCELILINNGKDRATRRLLRQIRGARIVHKSHNVGFLRAANEGAALARTPTLLFLNNDTRLSAGCLSWAYRALAEETGAGAVGAKSIGPDGRLLEAGGTVWQDGTTEGVGRGRLPSACRYNFRRDVDYVSGCFLMTPRSVFERLGGFDEAYAPAYYEDTDYCMRLWKAGYRVVYEPRAELRHYENASSPTRDAARQWIERHRKIFFQRHQDRLISHPYLHPKVDLREQPRLLCTARPRPQILYLDDRVPHLFQGSGFPRANRVIWALTELGWQVTLFPVTHFRPEGWQDAYEDLPPGVRIEWEKGPERLQYFLNRNRRTFDAIWVSRAHNLVALRRSLLQCHLPWGAVPVVYDSEAIAAERNFLMHPEQLLMGMPALETARNAEISLARGCAATVVVNEKDRRTYEQAGIRPVHVVGHAVEESPTRSPFEERLGFLFLGSLEGENSPNVIALERFITAIFPLIRSRLPQAELEVVGNCTAKPILPLGRHPGVRIRGARKDLTPFTEKARVMVAPHTVGAGLPLKVVHAARLGIPTIVSPLLASQMGWNAGLVVADPQRPEDFAERCIALHEDGALWKRIREQALERAQREYGQDRLRSQVESVLNEVRNGRVETLPEERVPVIHRGFEGFGDGPERRPTQ